MSYRRLPHCGCYYLTPSPQNQYYAVRTFLPLVQSEFHTTILPNSLHTTVTQTFSNPTKENIEKCKYVFPLYEGISVVGFSCQIGDHRLVGVVKEKEEAKAKFNEAVSKGQSAGLLEQSDEASDVFSTSLGNVAAGQTVRVEIIYIGELKNDVDVDGVRLTIPTAIAPRYGSGPDIAVAGEVPASHKGGIKITVDVSMPDDSPIRSLQSPSHPISVSLGVLSSDTTQDPSLNKASATLSLGETALEKDFVLMIQAKDTGTPKAFLETHDILKNHRALSLSLVPKFSLPAIRPEIIFVADRSGSMGGNIPMLKDAMRVFLKSLPVGVMFNICSFGSDHSFLWPKSKSYTNESLTQALSHVDTFAADYGGTETLSALNATIKQRAGDLPLEIMLLTDGDIWDQASAFSTIKKHVNDTNGQIRLFPLGIGNGVSHALIEGLARSGNGFASAVQDGEKLDKRVVRMLKGALSPHINDYQLEIKYQNDDDFELIDKVSDSMQVMFLDDVADDAAPSPTKKQKKLISLFDTSADPDKDDRVEKFLPDISVPKLLQAPHVVPSLYAFSRTTVYILMSPDTVQRNPVSAVLKATSKDGPLSLEIPIQALDKPGQTIHQLAARKAVQDLEEGRGWVHDARDKQGHKIEDRLPSRFDDVVKREAVRIGTKYQVANRWCSFVAVEDGEELDDGEEIEAEPQVYHSSGIRGRSGGRGRGRGGQVHKFAAPAPAPPPSMSAYPQAFQMQQQQQQQQQAAQSQQTSRTSALPMMKTLPSLMQASSSTLPGPQIDAKKSPMSSLGASAGFKPDARFTSRSTRSSIPFGTQQTSNSFAPNLPGSSGLFGTITPAQPGSGPGMSPPSMGGLQSMSTAASAPAEGLKSAPEELQIESDEDMGYGLFDDVASSVKHVAYRRADGGAQRKQRKMPDRPADREGGKATGMTTASLSDYEKVHQLVALQDFQGFWSVKLQDELSRILKLPVSAWAGKDDVWTTLLVVAFFEEKLREEEGVWEMVVEKARLWLEMQSGTETAQREVEGIVKGLA